MSKLESRSFQFKSHIREIVEKLSCDVLEGAYKLIIEDLSNFPDAAEPHNLLGIWHELNGNKDKARKHYRAAFALDPTFKPACRNLERISNIFEYKKIPYDYGIEPEDENINEKRN